MRRLRLLFVGMASMCAGRTAVAQGATGTVEGMVFDSIRGRPLPDATVQLVIATDPVGGGTFSTRTDSAGHFRIGRLPVGDYLGGYFHPLLDSLGFEGEKRAFRVAAGSQRLDFALPSPATIVDAICPDRTPDDSSGLLIGHVRAARDETPIAGGAVAVAWTELVQGALLVKPEERQRAAETTDEGWFALCDVPGETALLARAAHDADSSGFVRLTVPPRGFLHMPFFVGRATLTRSAASDSAAGAEGALARAARVALLRGRARLEGTVLDERGRPMPDADVLVWGTGLGSRVRSRGTFALDSLPDGTHTLEVRAVGYAPVQRVVHLAEGRPARVEVQLGERAVALPTVAVAARASARITMRRFYERARDAEKGINRGYFVMPEDMERRKPAFVTQMLDGIPGIWIVKNPLDQRDARVLGPMRLLGGVRCTMTIYLDGMRIQPRLGGSRDAHDPMNSVDALVDTHTVAAIEIYPHPTSAPPQYQPMNGVCGVILIWTK